MKGSIRRHRGAWQVRVTVGHRPDGSRIVRTRTVHGERGDAEFARAQMLVELGQGDSVGIDATVAETVEAWLGVALLEDSTRRDYRSAIERHITPTLGAVRVYKLRARDLDRLYAQLRAADVGPARIRRVHSILASALAQAVRWEWIARNVARDASPPGTPRPDPRPPSVEEVGKVLAALDGEMLAYVALSASLGARRGEVLGLQWGDVDLDAGRIAIRRALADAGGVRAGTGRGVYVKGTKTDRVRVVALDAGTVATLRSYRAFCVERAFSLGWALGPSTWLWHRDGAGVVPWRPDSTTDRFAAACRVAKVQGVTLKSLRHFVATQLLAAGVDARTVAGRLGHARTSTTTDIYAAWVPANDQAAADLLGALLRRPG